ncbi:M23 family metallopeptidase [Guptibacillus hwajinpoensis]|uniref:Murein DD-endopeptidase MepM/ murein hydrolase activator NlpD n=1 Tax=Guptibacillus hwajinpoensis TaxID=208199 RepID=A0ABU0JYC5_9BACL|nr:M23 family metallopeptidase [Alkalihalobacillus hemicentroti]MDQ0482088.1 murein DD-endopeptidase MepM/ murein hydrolase activator NlpD [Alkalihalobacillus hemicentroti]
MRSKVRRLFQLSIIVTSISTLLWIEPASASVHNLMKPVYHVYIDGEDIGIVDQEETLNENIDKLIKEQNVNGIALSVQNDVEVVATTQFRSSYDHEEALNRLEEELSFVAEGYELSFNDKKVGVFASEQQAKEALWSYAKPFLSKEQVKEIERTTNNIMATGEVRHPADSLEYEENLSITKVETEPSEVISEDTGVSRLVNGFEEEIEHEVELGDSLKEIATTYDIEKEDILDSNDLSNEEDITQGDKLYLLKEQSFVTIAETIELVEDEELTYETKTKKSSSLEKGTKKVEQQGKVGTKSVTYQINRENGKVVNKELIKEEVTNEPITEVVLVGTKEVSSKGSGSFGWPAVGGTITSKQGERWGSFHKGIDIAGVSNKTIRTVDNGTVTAAGTRSGYGNQITISHNNGLRTTYSHLASMSVSTGDTVQKGDKIGVMGTTGNSTGIHLHFEVYKNGKLQNPMKYL